MKASLHRAAGPRVIAQCPQCRTDIEITSAETMVYCVRCRKWCRPPEGVTVSAPPPPPKVRRSTRCH